MWPFTKRAARRIQGQWTCPICPAYTVVTIGSTHMELQHRLDAHRRTHMERKHGVQP